MSRYKVYLINTRGKRTDICWTDKEQTARDILEVISRVLMATNAAGEPKIELANDLPWIDDEVKKE